MRENTGARATVQVRRETPFRRAELRILPQLIFCHAYLYGLAVCETAGVYPLPASTTLPAFSPVSL